MLVCMCECACVPLCVCTRLSMCTEFRWTLVVLLCEAPLYSLRWSLPETEALHFNWAGWIHGWLRFRGLCPPTLNWRHSDPRFYACAGNLSELRSLCIHGKHSYPLRHFHSLSISFLILSPIYLFLLHGEEGKGSPKCLFCSHR